MCRAVLAVVLAIVACGPGVKPAPDKPTAGPDDPTCPVLVAGTSVSVEDTSDGAAFVFVTTGDVAAVRARAAALAERHNTRHAAMGTGGGPDGHEGHMQMPATARVELPRMGDMISVHSTATLGEVPNGARILFRPADAYDLAKLQSELRMHAQHLGAGTCEM